MMERSDFDYFGAGVTLGSTVPADDVLAQPSEFGGKILRLTGKVDSVCAKKGCWMRIGTSEKNILVRFREYGFFVPTDSAGREVIMEGVASISEISVEMRRHYLEDAGKPEEAAKVTEPETAVTFLATGVALKK
jgi:hypothetical protein